MFGWLATHVAQDCGRASGAPVERHWRRVTPQRLAAGLPALGSVLCLRYAAPPVAVESLPRGLLAMRRECRPMLRVRWLVAAGVVSSDGPREWLECRDRDGWPCARLHLLPDTDYLGWDALLAAGVSAPDAPRSRPDAARVLSAQWLRFRCRRLAGLALLDAQPVAGVSALGSELARGIARAEGVVLG